MGTFLGFLLILIGVLLVLAFAIALIARTWVLQIDPVVLRGIDVTRARDVVAMYVENVHDTRFGFPTGVFRIDEGRSSPTRLVAREVNFDGSMGFRIARYGFAIPAAFVAAAAEEGCLAGFMALMVGMIFAAFFIAPIVCLSVVEVVLRFLLRSEVTAELTPVAGESDACSARFTLRGLSAFGVRRQLQSGLKPPVLPTAHGGSAIENAPELWSQDRLNVVYAISIGVAVLAAAVIVALTPSLHGGGSTASGSYSSSSYESSSGYADSGGSSSSSSSSEGTDPTTTDQQQTTTDEQTTTGEQQTSTDEAQTTQTNPDLQATAADANAFTVDPPAGWTRDGRDVEHDDSNGKLSYYESHWHDPGTAKVAFLVDDTPGFNGSARKGAEGVRKLFLHVSDYREIDFSATTVGGRPAWRWEYESDGLHKVDTFLTACGTGYAVLGSAPVDQWDSYSGVFGAATDTLAPSCDGSSGSGEASSSQSSGSGSGSGSASPEAVLRAHFEHLDAGEYDAAFALMSPGYRAANKGWKLNRETADPGIDVVKIARAQISGDEAWVGVRFFARDRVDVKGSDTTCRRFWGAAHMLRVGGVWRYDPDSNHVHRAKVHASDPHCP